MIENVIGFVKTFQKKVRFQKLRAHSKLRRPPEDTSKLKHSKKKLNTTRNQKKYKPNNMEYNIQRK